MTATRYLVHCRGGQVIASERDRFAQLDGEPVSVDQLGPTHTVPGLGRVLRVVRVVAAEPER